MLTAVSILGLTGVMVLAVGTSTDIPPWAQWGVLGLLVLGFITRQIVPGATWREDRDRANALENETRTTFTPTIVAATRALENTAKLLEDFKDTRDEERAQLKTILQQATAVIEASSVVIQRAERALSRKKG